METMSPQERNRLQGEALAGVVLVYASARLLVTSACLPAGWAPMIWAAGYGASWLLRRPGRAVTQKLVGTFSAVTAVLSVAALQLGFASGSERWHQALMEIQGYLSGETAGLAAILTPITVHALCGFAAILTGWMTGLRGRPAVTGALLLFGVIRWNQYIPDMDSALVALTVSACFTIAVRPVGDMQEKILRHRLPPVTFSLMMALGCASLLIWLFPLESMRSWLAERLPEQTVLRNDYLQAAETGFRLSDTEWQPIPDRLGGPVSLRREPVMVVRASRPGLYLRGRVLTVYTGTAWENGKDQGAAGEPPLLAVPGEPFVLSVHLLNASEGGLFTPLNAGRVSAEGARVVRSETGLYRMKKPLWGALPRDYRVEGPSETAGAAEPVAAELRLPEIPVSVGALAETIAGTGDDAQRMQRLSTWLSQNGTYRLDVADPVPDQDFVAQFLNGGREGYCTYFASALAVMGREVGIPTRYVEGYRLPTAYSGRQTYLITSDRAHAWVEAWIDGRGWQTFDPTPTEALEALAAEPASVAEEPAPEQGMPQSQAELPESPAPGAVPRSGIAAAVAVLLLGLRVTWVEAVWLAGSRGPRGALWELYGAVSALALLEPPDSPVATVQERLASVRNNHIRALESHDIIGESSRLLYGGETVASEPFRALRAELWQLLLKERGLFPYLWVRYGTLSLFNRYFPLIGNRLIRKEMRHGAD